MWNLLSMIRKRVGTASILKETNRSSVDVEFTFDDKEEGRNSQHTQGNKQIKMGEFTPKSMLTYQSFA